MKRLAASIIASCSIIGSLTMTPMAKAQGGTSEIKGNLLIVGGALGESNHEVFNRFIELAGGKDHAKIGIVPAASAKLQSSKQFKDSLTSYGLSPSDIEILPISDHDFSDTAEDESQWKSQVNDSKLTKQIKDLTAVWFVGGDQSRIVAALRDEQGNHTKALDAIWDIYRKGAVLGGTSAGAAIMSEVMIAGGDSLGALTGGTVTAKTANGNKEYEPLSLEKGLGFFKHGIIDQHFNERARLGRLTVAALSQEKNQEENFAYGIDEDTAIVVNNVKDSIEVIGRNGLCVVNTSGAKIDKSLKGGTEINNVKISYLAPGDKVHYDTKTFEFPDSKDTTKGYEYYAFQALPATGVFTPYGRLKNYLSYSLVDNEKMNSVDSYLYDHHGKGYKLVFRKTDETQGYWGYTDGQKDDYSVVNVAMDIVPVKLHFNENTATRSTYKPSNFSVTQQHASQGENKGKLVITGGALGSTNQDVYETFIKLAGGKEHAKIGIIPAASSKLTSSKEFKKDLIQYGVDSGSIEILPISNHDFKGTAENEVAWSTNKNREELAQKIEGLTAIWFVGGDQTLITGSLLNDDQTHSKVLAAIWKTYKNGAVLGGTSAGAAIMSDVMLAGGDSFGALTNGFTEQYDSMNQQEGGPAYLEQGLGFFSYGIVDQHFDNKARLGRLIATAFEKGNRKKFAYGVDEDTALVVDNASKKAEVVGRGGVTIVDLSKVQANPNIPSSYRNIVISHLVPGDYVNLATKDLVIDPRKDATRGYEYYNNKVAPNTGVFSPHGLVSRLLAYDLVDNKGVQSVKSYSFAGQTGFELTFRKTPETNGYWAYKDGQKDDYSIVKVALDITPIKVEEDVLK